MLYLLSKEKKGSDTMSANVYNVESLLIGKMYNSRSVRGEIIDAEKTDKVWYANCDTYRVQVRSLNTFKDTYRYLAVKNSD
jgi:hypothetical protein